MAISIEEVQTEITDTRSAGGPDSAPSPSRIPNMDRIRLELRRDRTRLERLWTD